MLGPNGFNAAQCYMPCGAVAMLAVPPGGPCR
jgi:hypothetical protein